MNDKRRQELHDTERRIGRFGAFDLTVTALATFIVFGPLLLRRGFALRGDMVFVPEMPWKDAWLGLDGTTARFAPGDAVVWAGSLVVPGDVLQKIILAGAFVVGMLGTARLVSEKPRTARLAAMLFVVWNPWVFERLSIGQWPVVVGYLFLPTLVTATLALSLPGRAGRMGHWSRYAVVTGVIAVCSPAAAMVGVVLSVVVLFRGRSTRAVKVGAGATLVLMNAPWLLPSFVATEPIVVPPGQFRAFAAAAESSAGGWLSLLSTGGIWKTSVVPAERTVPMIVVVSALVSLLALAAVLRARRRQPEIADSLLVVGCGSLLVAGLPMTDAIADLLDQWALSAPFLGAFRDSHRFLGPYVLLIAFGLAHAVDGVLSRAKPGREALKVVALGLAALPVLCLPSMAWGMTGDLRAVTYPQEWEVVADLLAEEDDGDAVVLPWHGTYRGFGWNSSRAVLDPATRYFPGTVLLDDRHFLDDVLLESENERLSRIGVALERPDSAVDLRGLGVRWVVVHKQNGVVAVPPGEVVHDGDTLTLVDLGGAESPTGDHPAAGVDLVWVVILLAAGGWVGAIVISLTSGVYDLIHAREL